MMVTVEKAGKIICPLTMNHVGTGNFAYCAGPGCMAWRWKDYATDPTWVAAVRQAAEDTSPSRTKAAAHVMKNRANMA